MHYFLWAAALLIVPAPAPASDVGVTISIGQPGFYGQITLGNQYPAPRLIYPNPILAMPPAVAVQQPPVYLYVPPGHAKRWDKYCHRYNACYQPVYFVEKDWYNNVYVPHYHNQGGYPGGYHDDDDSRNYSQRKYQPHRYSDENDQGDQGERHGYDRHPGRGDGGNHDRGDREDHGKKGHERGNRRD
ncbi:MAG: hypothetical protein KGN35_01580 [Betaproteobacteria bacterium]|nr:hypothetical protein [Betaproteobacteria bacterium]